MCEGIFFINESKLNGFDDHQAIVAFYYMLMQTHVSRTPSLFIIPKTR